MRPTVLVLAALATLVGCSRAVAPPPPPRDPATIAEGQGPEDLARARLRWETIALQDYAYAVERSCFCPEDRRGPFAVTVAEGAFVSVTRGGRAVAPDIEVPSIEGLFDLIAEAYASGAAQVRVTYDAAFGYPLEVYIDRNVQMADEEVGYTVTSFTAG